MTSHVKGQGARLQWLKPQNKLRLFLSVVVTWDTNRKTYIYRQRAGNADNAQIWDILRRVVSPKSIWTLKSRKVRYGDRDVPVHMDQNQMTAEDNQMTTEANQMFAEAYQITVEANQMTAGDNENHLSHQMTAEESPLI